MNCALGSRVASSHSCARAHFQLRRSRQPSFRAPRQHLVHSSGGTAVLESTDETDWDTKYGEVGMLGYGTSAHQGPRDDMEDFLAVVPKARCGFLYAGVFDGHSGAAAADYLTEHLYNAFSHHLDEDKLSATGGGSSSGLSCPLELTETLSEIFKDLDKQLLSWLGGLEDVAERQAGSTATMLLARKDRLVVANVGDSRAVLCRDGAPVALTTEHRLTGKSDTEQAEIQRVKAAGGWVEDERVCDILAVSRAFGDADFKAPGVQRLAKKGVEYVSQAHASSCAMTRFVLPTAGSLLLSWMNFWDKEFASSVSFSGDPVVATPDVCEVDGTDADEFLVLATDGLWDVLTNEEAVKTARKHFQHGKDAQYVADHLTRLAIQRNTHDNVSCVVVDLGGGAKGWQKPPKRKLFGLSL